MRDLVSPLFRHRQGSALVFIAGIAATLTMAALATRTWDAQMTILVTRESPMVGTVPAGAAAVNDTDVHSEMQRIESRDVLEEVVTRAELLPSEPSADSGARHRARLARAVHELRGAISVQPLRNTAMLEVTYRARDPVQAGRVLDILAHIYRARQLAGASTSGADQFFSEQTERVRAELKAAEAKVANLRARQGSVAAAGAGATFDALSEFEARLQQIEAATAEMTRHISVLDGELAMLNASPGDAAADRTPATLEWLLRERIRVRAEREAQIARADAARRRVAEYRSRARRPEVQSIEQQQLLWEVNAAQDNLLLYQRKLEEARIADATNRTRIAAVVTEPPLVSPLPQSRRLPILAGGGVLTLLLSLAVAYLLHAVNPYFRTPREVHGVLGVPVLASLPAHAD
jgi:uncharacterized protein involved in exopolysaccharide biosynthesis